MDTALPLAKLANLHFVTPRLAVGGDLSAEDPGLSRLQLAEICELGITHVVDTRMEWSDEQAVAENAQHVRYLHHGMDDAGQRVPPEWFEEAVAWVEAAYEEDSHAIVLTHCHMGINRGPSLGFAVLLAQGCDPVEAISAIRAARPQANVWYAADALDWHHARTGVDAQTAAKQRAALEEWREQNQLDVIRLVRERREAEQQRR
ncbi:MAG: dual specificity protein phosphatase family protein [Actinomycetota bacterium]|nr:dual specificity protein phosphatase family protein [Actinomycetota bacterium]